MRTERNYNFKVTADDGQNMTLRGRLEDYYHDILVDVVLDKARLRIISASGEMNKDRIPYPDGCGASLPKLDGLAGLEIRQGFTRELRSRLGGEMGCPHLVQLADQLCRFGLGLVKSDEARLMIAAGERERFPSIRKQMGECSAHTLATKDDLPTWIKREFKDKLP